MEFSAGDNMTYADEAMPGSTASSELVRLKGEQAEMARPLEVWISSQGPRAVGDVIWVKLFGDVQ
jgi:hypothetical protein